MFSLGKLSVLSKQIWWSKNIMISFWFWAILQITDFICRLICRHWSVNYSITICFLVLHYTAFISQWYCTRQNQLFIVSLVLSISTKLQRIADSKQSYETNTFGVNIYLIYQTIYCHQRVQVAAKPYCRLYPHSSIIQVAVIPHCRSYPHSLILSL